ncbi:uncharacterized protein K489DRAFT_381336 [Dissoconium aciculare CBS 342.82]|uniref:Uncharacterized protein n=1 Tax=Dissoconium aciculare CBS 342.82 TaxID=1314786 RepID=A0A6J3M326_9PEZI|nr:uncharacterized protein K489DRAFT_381336 [Dissoconium aciculare CBS 342.82]KAF1821342.1 hypothetical protein K489DRAFT_381336 [Dissoconium aciculare CBS 342.82]
MGLLKLAFPPASLYNSIPFIHDMESVVKAHADDLVKLRALLVKHDMPTSVCVKLLHIHFHLRHQEIIVTQELDASPHVKIPFLEPMSLNVAGKVYGCSYVVDHQGDLQVFEFTRVAGGPDFTAYPAFVAEFCGLVMQLGVQDKFGLAINSGVAEDGAWMELDYPEKRATFLLPENIAVPRSEHLEMRVTTTKFPRPDITDLRSKQHAHVEHSWSKRRATDGEEILDGVTTKGGLRLTGMALEHGTPFHQVVSAIAAAA